MSVRPGVLPPAPTAGGATFRRAAGAIVAFAVVAAGGVPGFAGAAGAQELPPLGREALGSLTFEPLEWDPPEPARHEVAGVPVLHLEDRTLPLVTVHVRLRGGFTRFPREYYAPASGLSILVRNGGSRDLPPDSVDAFLADFAVQTAFGAGGDVNYSSMNVLTEHLDTALAVWGGLLKHPRFDPDRVDVWRGTRLESVRRRSEDPARLAFGVFNRLMYGDHPIGWEMEAADLEPALFETERLRWLHERIFCRDNLLVGVSGDVRWEELEPRIEELLDDWPRCPEPLPEPPDPLLRSEGGVFVVPREIEQSTVVMAHPTELRMGDRPDYYASLIGNSVLGAAGFQSRLMERVRTEAGYAYSVSSLWTAPRDAPGLLGAVTRTRKDRTVATIRLVLEVLEGMREAAPAEGEVSTIVSEIVNGFVFNFDSTDRILARRMSYEAMGMPTDWLERYLDGVRDVAPADVLRVFRRWLRPGDMTILVVGDPAAFSEELSLLGDVVVLEPDGGGRGAGVSPARPGGSPRSRR